MDVDTYIKNNGKSFWAWRAERVPSTERPATLMGYNSNTMWPRDAGDHQRIADEVVVKGFIVNE